MKRLQKSWTHLTATVDHVRSEDCLRVEMDTGASRIVVVLEEVGGRLLTGAMVPGRSDHLPDNRAGPISVFPAGCEPFGNATKVRLLRLLVIDLDDPEMARTADEDGYRVGKLVPRLMFADAGLENLCTLIADECTVPGRNGTLYADGLSAALMAALARMNKVTTRETARGGLSPALLRRAQEYMIDHVSRTVPLRHLADLTEVSLAHFCRAFKASTGKAPHQWLIEARIEQAKSSLLEKRISIAEISVALGFCDQAHFTRTFSKLVGTTPLAWQKQ